MLLSNFKGRLPNNFGDEDGILQLNLSILNEPALYSRSLETKKFYFQLLVLKRVQRQTSKVAKMSSKPLTFIFKKNCETNECELYGFKKDRYDTLRIIDEDKRALSHHQTVWSIQALQEQVTQATSQKTVTVNLFESTWNHYVKGTFTSEFDGADEEVTNASSTATLSETIRDFMRANQESNKEMIKVLTTSMAQLVGRKDTQRMTITRFDGSNKKPRSWMTMFERACDTNHCLNDELQISNLKSCFVAGSAADRWFSSRIIDEEEEDQNWVAWKEAFFEAFCQNRVQTASKALHWEYRSGSIMDYFYEKERLLKIAFHDMGNDSFISLVLLGLPLALQTTALGINPTDKKSLIQCLQRLPATLKHNRVEKRELREQPQQEQKGYDTRSKTIGTKQQEKMFHPKSDTGKLNKPAKVNTVQDSSEPDVINSIITDELGLDKIKLLCNGKEITALMDSGATVNIVSAKIVNENNWETTPVKKIITGWNSTPCVINSAVTVHVSGALNNKTIPEVQLEAFVAEQAYDFILSNPSMKQMNISLKIGDSPAVVHAMHATSDNKITTIHDVKKHFPDLLREDYIPNHEVDFKLRSDAQIIQRKPYRLSREKYSWVSSKLDELLKRNIIRYSESNWASPIVVVPKDNGKDFRLCVDYRGINNETFLDPFPFPIIDDVICNFGGCEFFTKIDLRDGFHQLGLSEETRKFTAFVTPLGLFEYTRLPFGWKNSPPVFQRFMMNVVLRDLLKDRRVCVYVDDIVIGSKSMEEMQALLSSVLTRLNKHGLTINENKCEFCVRSITFLGRIIDGKTRTTRQETVDKIMNMQEPVDVHTLRVFLGLAGHFQVHIPNFSGICRPLNHLKKKDVVFEWTDKCKNAFNTLIKIIASNPVLHFPDWSLPFELCTDASHRGTGAVLYQRDVTKPRKEQLRLIGFHSHTFTPAEINYNVTEKECLAVKLAIEHFESYLEARRFKVHTDHKALTTLMTMDQPKGRLARWQMSLMLFEMEINHRKGTELTDADAVSRLCLDDKPFALVSLVTDRQDHLSKALILKTYHDDPASGGHDGFLRTYLKIKDRFQWPNMRKEVEEYVKSCHECQVKKFKYRPKHSFMVLPPHAKVPYESIHLDYGELKKKSEGIGSTRSFVALIDENTRMLHTKAIRQSTSSLIKWLLSLSFFSSIKKIISDNGPSFASQELRDFTAKNNITHIFTAVLT